MGSSLTTAEFLALDDSGEGISIITMSDRLVGGAMDSMFGGVGLAAGLISMERLTGRAPVYMTCQFASPVAPPETLSLRTEVVASGKSVSQVRTTATCDDQTILVMFGACGDRREDHRGVWRHMPEVTPPERCAPMERNAESESLHEHVEVRMVDGMFGFALDDTPGRGTPNGRDSTLFWVRMPGVVHDTAALALFADYLPSAVGNTLGQRTFCSSLDNTIRFNGPIAPDETSEWVLCDSTVEFVSAGFAVSHGRLWSRDGQLLATANQSMTASIPRP